MSGFAGSAAERRRLRGLLIGLLLILLLPSLWLASRAYEQLRYEALHRYRLGAEALASEFELSLTQALTARIAQLRAPGLLSERADAPVLGPFQLSAEGVLSGPDSNAPLPEALAARVDALLARLVPSSSSGTGTLAQAMDLSSFREDVMASELPSAEPTGSSFASALGARRLSAESARNREVYSQLVTAPTPSKTPSADRAEAARLQDKLSLKDDYLKRQARALREVEVAAEREPDANVQSATPKRAVAASEERADAEVGTDADFVADSAPLADATSPAGWLAAQESAVEAQPVGAEHLLLYQRNGTADEPGLRGLLLERAALLDTPLARIMTKATGPSSYPTELAGLFVTLSAGEQVLTTLPAQRAMVAGELVHRRRLARPLDDLQLVFSASPVGLPAGAGAVLTTAGVLLCALFGGFAVLYGLGLRELERRAQQQNFVSAVSHELKSPLTAIRMYGEMLMNGWVTEDRQRGYFEFIHGESERLSRLVDNVLRFSQINRGTVAVTLTTLTVAELKAQLDPRLTSLAQAAQLELTFDIPESLNSVAVAVDPDGMLQILTNLLDNAAKFARGEGAPDGTLTPVVIAVQGLPSNLSGDVERLRLGVRDFGPGVPEAARSRVFDLFYRAEAELTRSTQGTGIGLALVAELVRAMDGRIELEDAAPGAEFVITLPVATAGTDGLSLRLHPDG